MSKVLSIIAEYNPFHNGHLYHLNESKKLTNADITIAVIGGNFTQRGDTSIIDKWSKTKMALENGIDLVIELPLLYSISSAENFASGAIKILNSLGIVDYISFGTECDNISTLKEISSILQNEPPLFKEDLNSFLKEGLSFPAARQKAISKYFNNDDKYLDIVNSPNNILAIEYLKALESLSSNISPICINRFKSDYNDSSFSGDIASATAIRKCILDKTNTKLSSLMPNSSFSILNNKSEDFVPSIKCFEKEILYTFRSKSIEEIKSLPDVSEGLEFALKTASLSTNNLETFLNTVKSKRYTLTRLQRICIYSLLNVSKEDINISKNTIPYVRILGFNDLGKSLLTKIKKEQPNISLVTSSKKFVDSNYDNKKEYEILFNKDILATNIYTLACKQNFKANIDFTNNMCIYK